MDPQDAKLAIEKYKKSRRNKDWSVSPVPDDFDLYNYLFRIIWPKNGI